MSVQMEGMRLDHKDIPSPAMRGDFTVGAVGDLICLRPVARHTGGPAARNGGGPA